MKCIVGAAIPNNAGTLDAIRVTAPGNTIVNALHPAAVSARFTIGPMLPDVVCGALHQRIPGRVPAEGTSNLWNLKPGTGACDAGDNRPASVSAPCMATTLHPGGAGARPHQDGLSATPFPPGVRNVPVEITETIAPVVIWTKEYRPDSGGAGTWRGGLGQVMEVEHRHGAPFGIFATFERVHFAARGRDGGAAGAKGRLFLADGTVLRGKEFQVIPEGARLAVEMPGGGGFGPPEGRDVKQVGLGMVTGLVTASDGSTVML